MKIFLSFLLGIFFLESTNGQERTVTNNIDISNIGISSKQSELIFDKLKHYPNQTQLSIAIIDNLCFGLIGTLN